MARELILYCDESVVDGDFFSNFYGGALIQSEHFIMVKQALEAKKQELNLFNEVKWSKITSNYYEKYICLLNCFFDYIEKNQVKMRIMFRQNRHEPHQLNKYHRGHGYFLLYYQFIKHAFGLKYYPSNQAATKIRLYFDRFPDNKEKATQFKSYLQSLTYNKEIRRQGLQFTTDNIIEVKSHDHVILQCVDIVLGAMQFRLNDKHKKKPDGELRRSKRTIAKEKVYNHIRKRICTIYQNFNIGTTTGTGGELANYWHHPYRHWKFIPSNHRDNLGRTKKHRQQA